MKSFYNNWKLVIIGCLTLGMAPFFPEPHIWDKLKWVAGGARGMAFQPDLPNRWRAGEFDIALPEVNWKNKTFAALAVMAVTKVQLNRVAGGKKPKKDVSPFWSLLADQVKTKQKTQRYRQWRRQST